MIKLNQDYLSFIQHLADNGHITFNEGENKDEDEEPSRPDKLFFAYFRFFPGEKDRVKRQLLGGFQPLMDMHKDLVNTFRPYKSWKHVEQELLQPVRGLGNVFAGILLLIGVCVYAPLAGLGIIQEKRPLKKAMVSSWCIESISRIIRGATQLVFTPFVPIKMLFRGITTSILGWQKIEWDLGINRLIAEAATHHDNDDDFDDDIDGSQMSAIAEELHRKFYKARKMGRTFTADPTANNPSTQVVKTLFNYYRLERQSTDPDMDAVEIRQICSDMDTIDRQLENPAFYRKPR